MPGQRKKTVKQVAVPVKNANKPRRQRKKFTRMPQKTWSTDVLIPLDDPRRTLVKQEIVALPGSRNAITIDTSYDGETLINTVMGYICAALQKGYLANAPDPNYPFWAANYVLAILNSYVKGIVPAAQSLPEWLHCLGRALAPKDVPSAHHGLTDYKVSYTALQFPPGAIIPISPAVYGYESLLWIPASNSINGFPTALPPTPYSLGSGEQAWNSVCQFMSDTFPELKQQNTMISINESTVWDKNVSPMCVVVQTTGWGPGNSGGQDFQAQLEVPVHTPLLSVMNKPIPSGDETQQGRAATYSMKFSGTPLAVGAYLPGLIRKKHWNTKKSPHFKFIDFLEFADVLAQYVVRLQSEFASAPTSQLTVVQPATYRCPLTIQEMQLILRNEIMYVFGVSQAGAQGLAPRLASSTSDNEFVPFASGTTTCATAALGMKLPKAFVENIKSLAYVCADVGPDGRKLKYSPTHYIPVLGKYAQDVLVGPQYLVEWIIQGQTTILPAFFSESATSVKDKTGAWKSVVEPPIDLIDGAAGSSYIFINDFDRLSVLTSFWNEWITRLESVSSQLTTVTSDGGLKVLGALFMTRHWSVPAPNQVLRDEFFKDERFISRKEISETVYSDRQQYALSSGAHFISGTDTFFRNWVLPINPLSGTNRPSCNTGFVRMQSIAEEPGSIITSTTGEAGIFISTLHANYASALVRGSASPLTEWDQLLADLDTSGHAGILSSLASAVGGAIFGPGVGAAIGSIGNALGV